MILKVTTNQNCSMVLWCPRAGTQLWQLCERLHRKASSKAGPWSTYYCNFLRCALKAYIPFFHDLMVHMYLWLRYCCYYLVWDRLQKQWPQARTTACTVPSSENTRITFTSRGSWSPLSGVGEIWTTITSGTFSFPLLPQLCPYKQ